MKYARQITIIHNGPPLDAHSLDYAMDRAVEWVGEGEWITGRLLVTVSVTGPDGEADEATMEIPEAN